jgi:TolB-like protein
LLEGETLRARLGVGALAPRKVVAYATQLAEGLAAAHERGLMHRDLKPENVFITRDGRVKLLDFGLAKPLEDARDGSGPEAATQVHVTQPGMVVGTPAYMSPEQVRGERVDARSDLFAFGVVFYEMLSGRGAFDHGSVAETLSAVLRDEPSALLSAGAQIPLRLERIVRRCLEKSPGERFQSARDLAFALSTALEGTGETPAAVTPNEISVVVLPFANLSPDPDTEFLADGFTEEAISDLSGIRSLKVISRTSAMRLKGADKDATTIASDLGVRYVVEGSVRRSGDVLRVTARLVDAEADMQLWSNRCSGVTSDIFSIQERVARGIVEALSVTLTPQEAQALAVHHVTNPRAYESYLRARSAIWSFNPDSLRAAQRHLENALALVGDNELLLAALGHARPVRTLRGAARARPRAAVCRPDLRA